ncbi:hypothetical protein SAMN05444158_2563 [Bradyrhizobium canariense]|uniref:Uncharacterized protein n=1 Tax=Bradyrhizobium canariense TaxID=255045 RepID=A0A1H1TIE7_9BRAD|nr:hypothetical protein SAMN05444158_2563 [Bradyrhizobium canariense]
MNCRDVKKVILYYDTGFCIAIGLEASAGAFFLPLVRYLTGEVALLR